MSLLTFRGPPSAWISDKGKPAPVFSRGLPSYETDDGFLVMDVLFVTGGIDVPIRMIPWSWIHSAGRSYGSFVRLHDQPTARRDYRPLLYRLRRGKEVEGHSSQQELMWRAVMRAATDEAYGRAPFPDFSVANVRAQETLLENLSPLQRIEYHAEHAFRVRGGQSGNVYRIEPSNGFQLVSETTREIIATYCLHPEEYVPHDDVALATKLLLEDPETEQEALDGATRTFIALGSRATRRERYAADIERELIV